MYYMSIYGYYVNSLANQEQPRFSCQLALQRLQLAGGELIRDVLPNAPTLLTVAPGQATGELFGTDGGGLGKCLLAGEAVPPISALPSPFPGCLAVYVGLQVWVKLCWCCFFR